MKPFRLTVAGMLAAMVVIGLGFAALARPGGMIATLFPLATLLVLLWAALAVWMGRGGGFSRGVAVFGIGFLLLDHMTYHENADVNIDAAHLGNRLAADLFVRLHPGIIRTYFDRMLADPNRSPVHAFDPDPSLDEMKDQADWESSIEFESFRHALRSGMTLTIALLGGLAGLMMSPRRRDAEGLPLKAETP